MKIHHIALSVKNLEKSTRFYKDIFGFDEVKKFEKKDLGGKAVLLKLGDTRLELWEFVEQIENKDDFSNLNILGMKHFSIEVDGIDQKYRELKSKNIEITEPKLGASGARYCFLKDPDGLPIELYEEETINRI